jgi:hypothetical protein
VYLASTWTFVNQGDTQTVLLQDSNGQKWKVVAVIGNSYNNNLFTVEEI